jgi:hypothetical protein
LSITPLSTTANTANSYIPMTLVHTTTGASGTMYTGLTLLVLGATTGASTVAVSFDFKACGQ